MQEQQVQSIREKVPQKIKKKLTITQLKRYLPLPQPTFKNILPITVSHYLLSPQFSNLSSMEQRAIQEKYSIVYRHYFGIQDIVNYLDQLTSAKYTKNSIRKAICNSSQKYGVVDWYKIVRTVMKDDNKINNEASIVPKTLQSNTDEYLNSHNQQSQNHTQIQTQTKPPIKQQHQLVTKIKHIFKQYKNKKIIWKGVEQVSETKNNLQQKVLKQLIKQATNQVKQHIQKNRVYCENILYQYEKQYSNINFIVLQRLLNKQFQLYMDRKKCIYVYLHFDANNKGYFSTSLLLSELLVVQKAKIFQIEPQYLTDTEEIYEQIRSEFNVLFQSAADVKTQFVKQYHKINGQRIDSASPAPQEEISSEIFYNFFCLHLNNRYSHYQSDLILKKIQYVGNIHFLFNKPKPLELASFLQKFVMKKNSARTKLKQQNQVFYSYRKIIMNLITRCKQKKVSRQKFTQIMTGVDPQLKYNSFYCVWRVYPSVINVERMIQTSKLSKFACYLKLRKTNEEQFYQIYQDLIEQYPQGTKVMFSKVEQKINLALEFMLENSNIKYEHYDRFDQVDYRKTIDQIIQPDFQIIIRKYIFKKVAEKTYSLWVARKKRMQALKIIEGLKKMMIASQSKKSLDSSKKISPNKSKSSLKTRKSIQPKYDPQSLQIAKWNIDKVLNQLQTGQKYLHKQFHKDTNFRYHLCVNSFQKYDYRTIKPRFSIDAIVGIIGIGQQLLFLKNNKIEGVKAKFLYKPGIQIIDFTTTNQSNDIIILTSYYALEFYNLSQRSNYSYKSIDLLDEVQCITNNSLDEICEDRVYSKFPVFIRTYNNLIVVNTTISNNKICIIDNQTDYKINQIVIKQRQHIFTKSTQKVFKILKKHPKCNKIVSQLINLLSSTLSLTQKSIKQILQSYYNEEISSDYTDCDANQELRKLSTKQLKQMSKNLLKYTPCSLNSLLLKQQFGMLTPRKMPQSLIQVLQTIKSELAIRNTSLLDMLFIIDRQQQGYVKMKSFKDYLLKITQQVYLFNEKEIDQYLKDMCIGKNVPYQAICQILIQWNYKIWERPRLVVRDFIYEEQAELIIYTVQGQIDVYIRNAKDSCIVGILKEHSRAPQIAYIQQSMLLVTGDDNSIRIWRLFEDFINKYDQNPPWEINAIYQLTNAHENLITSISYLPRAHCLVTTSLDSTVKFWKITQQKHQSNQTDKQQTVNASIGSSSKKCFCLKQQTRLYSQQHYFLQGKPNLLTVNSEQQQKPQSTNPNKLVNYESISISKISKQINENNRYKFEHTIQSYHIERMKIQTGPDNIHIENIPQKLARQINNYAKDVLSNKKTVLMHKWIKQKQLTIQRINLVTYSLQRGLYQAVKKYYIFGNQNELQRLASFLNKKNDKGFMIYKVLFQEYGLRVIEEKINAPLIGEKDHQLSSKLMQTNFDAITMPQPQLKSMLKRLQSINSNSKQQKSIDYSNLRKIVQQYLVGSQYEKFENILDSYFTKQSKQKDNKKMVKLRDLQQMFRGYQLQSQIDKFYCFLRNLKISLRERNKKLWELFVVNKSQLQKRNKINNKQFGLRLTELGFQEDNINLAISFLSKNQQISLHQLIYFIKIAQEAVTLQFNASSNYSNVFLKNSRVLQTRLNKFKDDQDPNSRRQDESMEDKLAKFDNSHKQSGKMHDSSRKSSSKKHQHTPKLSDTSSAGDRSRQKSQPKRQQIQIRSHHFSSSGSRLTLSRSYTKDTVAREAHSVIKKIKELFKNQNKSLWDIISLTIPDFMENLHISESQYFSMFRALNSPVYLSDKIKLLNFVMRQADNYTSVNLNILFEFFQTSHFYHKKTRAPPTLPGQKYLFNFITSKLCQNKMKLQHSITATFFQSKQQQNIEQLLTILQKQPFNLLNFCLRQIQLILITQNKSAFTTEQIYALIMDKISKYNIKVQLQQIGYIDELEYRIDNRHQLLQSLLPKQATDINNGKVNYSIFRNMIKGFFNQKQAILENQFIKLIMKCAEMQRQKQSLVDSPDRLRVSPTKKLNTKQNLIGVPSLSHEQMLKTCELKYKQFIKTIQTLLQQQKKTNNSEKDTLKKFIKTLQAKKVNLLTFFLSLDPNRNYYINQMQLIAGLAQLKIHDNFWSSIKKKYTHKLYYNQLITHLIQRGVVDYKCVDSELEAAMSKFIRKFVRNDDIQIVYDRIRNKQSEQLANATYQSFSKAIKTGNLFKQQQIFYIFSAFVNAQNLKQSKFSNDDIIKDTANTKKSFTFKMFADVLNSYRNQNISKSPLYKLCDWLRRRNISFLNQFVKWMQRNKKVKQVGQALKNKENSLSKPIFVNFIKDFNTGISDKQIKDMLGSFPEKVQFSLFNQRLEQIYKKGNSNIAAQQINNYLQKIYQQIKNAKVSIQRLYKDFTNNSGMMKMSDFSNVATYLQIGLTKIQIRQIFQGIDTQKKGYITLQQLSDALQQAAQFLQKKQEDYELENILQKILKNHDKYSLKPSRLTFDLTRACLIFQKLLTGQQVQILYHQAQDHLKVVDLTQKLMQQYIRVKQLELRSKKDKKYKQLTLKFLNFLKKLNLEVSEIYYYFSKDTNSLLKNKFLILYQSLELKCNIVEINALYTYLDQNKSGIITLSKWEDKFNIILFQNQKQMDDDDNQSSDTPEQELQVFYKVKLLLSEIYLAFIRKLFKQKQIYAYFDYNGNGQTSHDQFLTSLANLGFTIEEDMEKRLVNYLDRYKNGHISISTIVNQLQNCLASKSKLILSTKTACIFKSKVHLIQQKQEYFIQKLVNLQYFVQIKGKLNSAILITDLIAMIRDFGIILGQDELNDIQRNFALHKDNLSLYPLYYMFVNIFKSAEYNYAVEDMEKQRFHKLFEALVKNNITMKIFEKIQTTNQVINFLTQLKIFTPIQIKLIVQKITIPDTILIDHKQLTYQLRNSYLSNKSQAIKKTTVYEDVQHTSISHEQKLRRQLKALINPTEATKILKATSGRISQTTFSQLLNKLNLVFTKNQTRQFFTVFSDKKQYILLQKLISQHQSREEKQISMSVKNIGQKQTQNIAVDKNNYNQEQQQANLRVLLNHIVKQIDFKGVSLQQAWQKYYQNFGYITFDSFKAFLIEIGFNFTIQPHSHTLQKLLLNIYEQTSQRQIKRSYFQDLMRQYNQYPKKGSKVNKYYLQLIIFEDIINYLIEQKKLNSFLDQLEQFISNQTGKSQIITIQAFYTFLQKYYSAYKKKKILNSQKTYLKFMASNLMAMPEQQMNTMLHKIKQKILKHSQKKISIFMGDNNDDNDDQQIFVKDPSAALLETKQALTHMLIRNLQLIKVCKHNFIWNYQRQVEKLEKTVKNMSIPIQNLHRLSTTLLCQQLLENPYLLKINPTLQYLPEQSLQPNKQHAQSGSTLQKIVNFQTYSSKSLSLSTLNNLIIDTEQLITERGIYLINNKYHGLLISSSLASKQNNAQKIFENLHNATKILHPNFKFYRAKSYYLWEPIQRSMPKMAINYRWKYIPQFIVKILQQFKKIAEQGFSVPHFNWDGMSLNGMQQLGFVTKIDQTGQYLQDITYKQLLSIQDPYAAPQIFMNISKPNASNVTKNESKTNNKTVNHCLTNKVDSWIFGCLLYEFVWGHAPKSFIVQLFNYIKDRQANIQLAYALKIQQLPSDFYFSPFDFDKIGKVLTYEHELTAIRGQPQDYQSNITYFGYRGIIKKLQIIYGSQLMYYKDDIKLFQQIMQTIHNCMNPIAQLRPNLVDVLQQYQPLLENNHNFKQYLSILDDHKQVSDTYQQILEPLLNQYQNSFKLNYDNNSAAVMLQKIIKKLAQTIKGCLTGDSINQKYVVPKVYPWPENIEQASYLMQVTSTDNARFLHKKQSIMQSSPAKTNININKANQPATTNMHNLSLMNVNMAQSRNFNTSQVFARTQAQQLYNEDCSYNYAIMMNKNKQKIRMQSTYNVMAFINNQHILEMIVNLCIKIDRKQVKREQIFSRIFDCLLQMLQSIRDYSSMLSGYIPNLLQAIIQLICEQEFTFVLGSQNSAQSKTSLRSLQLTACKKKCIMKLQRIVYVNGTGNIEYLPVKQFLQYDNKYRKLFEYFYSAIKLGSPQQYEQYLAINYFIPHIQQASPISDTQDGEVQHNEQIIWEVIQYFKIDATLLKLLALIETNTSEIEHLKAILNCMLKLSTKITASKQDVVSIFSCQVFYVQLHRFISISTIYADSVAIKTIIIQLLQNIVRNLSYSRKILKLMLAPSYNIIKQILRMLIQPNQKYMDTKNNNKIGAITTATNMKNTSNMGRSMNKSVIANNSLYLSESSFRMIGDQNKTAQYQEYASLMPVLSSFISTVQLDVYYMKQITKIEGSQFILEAYRSKTKQFYDS